MRISFLAPSLPPAVCGIADHTQHLAEAMRGEGVEVGFIHCQPRGTEDSLPEGPVDRWKGGARDLQRCVLRQNPDWLWIQLSSYGFSRLGAPLRLGRAIATLLCAAP